MMTFKQNENVIFRKKCFFGIWVVSSTSMRQGSSISNKIKIISKPSTSFLIGHLPLKASYLNIYM